VRSTSLQRTVRVQSLSLRNFRNHVETSIGGLAPQINVLAGPNGAGKTSILEALSLLTVTKSFTTYSDSVLIGNSAIELTADASFTTDLGVPHRVSVTIERGPPIRKTIMSNSERLRTSADLIGRAPVVVLTPEEKIITGGPPATRRRFLNLVLSQASRAYLEDEMEYRRALKQRNAILTEAKQQRRSLTSIQPSLMPWTTLVLKHGVRIMKRRLAFAESFRPRLLEAYAMLSSSREQPLIEYVPMGVNRTDGTDLTDFERFLQAEAAKCEIEEMRRGTTLFGPHRDDLALYINPGQEAKLYASQGQHKTLIVAMKLAEFEFLREASGETPILLLDDVFSELDDERAAQLLHLAASGKLGQTFITSTERVRFEKTLDFASGDHAMFLVENGGVIAQ
jgi:DNA replication and repair protein RecF